MSNSARSRIDEQALNWFVRLRDESVGDAERAAFAKWRLADPAHARAFDELSNLWSDLEVVGTPRKDSPSLPATLVQRWNHRSPGPLVASLAAVALTFGGYGMLAPPGGLPALLADARTAPGQVRDLTLPDGSHVRMAGASALSYDISAHDRRVTMIAGRAFFAVRHETRPFRVLAGSAEVRDIGTAFEIATAADRSAVSVARGQVEVALNRGAAETLHAGQSVSFDKVLGPIETVAPGDVAAWRDDRLVFENARLRDVVDELQSFGAGRIVLLDSTLGEKRLTGAFDTRGPGEALDAVAGITGARVTRIGPISFLTAHSSDKSITRP